MNSLSFAASSMAQSFCYALLYSLGQGLLLFGALFILLKALPGMSARIKYGIAYSTFAAVFIWFVDTWITQYATLRGVTVFVSNTVHGIEVSRMSTPIVVSISPSRYDVMYNFLPHVGPYVPIIITVYFIGLAFMVCRFTVNILQLRSLSKSGISAADSKWMPYVQLWQQHLGIARKVNLFLSDRVDVPTMLGTLKPLILLPVATISNLSTEQVEAIILHELAHIKRHDYLLNLLQTVVETLLFFNPFIWLISSIIRREREHCCDDLVIECSANPLHYAIALTLLEDNRINNSLSLAATGHKNQLFHRIKRIMEMKKDNMNHSKLSVVVLALIAIIFFAATISYTPSFAQKVKDDKKKAQTTTTVKTVTIDSNGKKKVVTKTTNSSTANSDDDDDAFDVNISVNEADTKHATAKIIVTSDKSDAGSNNQKVKKIIVKSDGVKATTIYNMEKIEKEIEAAKDDIDRVDWNKVKDDVSRALAEVEHELNTEKLRKEIRVEVRKALQDSHESLEKAKKEIEMAKKEIVRSKVVVALASGKKDDDAVPFTSAVYNIDKGSDELEDMLKKMDKNRLIDRSSKFTIKKEGSDVYVNGEKQSPTIVNSYTYLKGKDVTITGDKDDLRVELRSW